MCSPTCCLGKWKLVDVELDTGTKLDGMEWHRGPPVRSSLVARTSAVTTAGGWSMAMAGGVS